jgi:hypothetical protein
MIIKFSGHKLYRCPRECEGCMICEGGLASCVTCGGGEASLPRHCPGARMTCEEADRVQAGTLDYDRQMGWYTLASTGRIKV